MKMSIFAEGPNGLRRSDMEPEAIMDQRHRAGPRSCINGFPKKINRNSPTPKLQVGVAIGGVAVEVEVVH